MRERVQVTARRAAEYRHQRGLADTRDLADRRDPARVELGLGDRADAPEPADRERMQELELAFGRDHEQPVGLGHAAGDLREELRARDADRDAQSDAFEHLAAQPHRDLGRCARDPEQATDIEEGLVDRQALDQRRGVLEHLEHGLARGGVRLHARPHDDRARAEAARVTPRPSRCARRRPWPRSWPRAPRPPPTITGRPRSRGSSRCSTDA